MVCVVSLCLSQSGQTEEDTISGAAQSVLLSVQHRYSDILAATLIEMLNAVQVRHGTVNCIVAMYPPYPLPKVGSPFLCTVSSLSAPVDRCTTQAVPTDTASPEHCLVVDAVYKAMGITVFCISDHVDFSTWFMGNLAPILQVRVGAWECLKRASVGGWGGGGSRS